MTLHKVVIKSYDEKDYEEVITKKPVSYHSAVTIMRGADINLNHDNYYTEIIDVNE